MKIEVIGIGENVQAHAKELAKGLKELLSSDRGQAKLLVKEMIDKAREMDIDPRHTALVLLETSAIAVYCLFENGAQGRKDFKKLAGIAYDRAEKIYNETHGIDKDEPAAD